jgi:hypothetical protein
VPAYGRLVDHDPLSRSFAHPQPAQLVPKTVLWAHHAPVLDQGNLGSCTGNALAQCLNTDYFAPSLRKVNKGQPLLEHDAVKLYSLGTRLDGIPGNTYPPTDGGGSGLGVCKAGTKLGFLRSYRHAFSFTAFLAALQTQPLIVGTAFYKGMEDPARDGLVKPTGELAGGHEYCVLGGDYGTQRLTFLNSWSAEWGVNGRFLMDFADFESLLADQGDATIPVGVA